MASDAHPPMTAASYDDPRGGIAAHDHAVCVYDSHEDLARPLGRFIEEGLGKRDLSIFVHSFATEDEAWAFLERAKPDVRRLSQEQLVVVSLYRDTFQGKSTSIDYDHVTTVIESLLAAAKKGGRNGVRIFVDASRIYFGEKRTKEWFAFESWLGRRLHHSVGLVCAYQRSDATDPDLFAEMLRTHAYRFDAL